MKAALSVLALVASVTAGDYGYGAPSSSAAATTSSAKRPYPPPKSSSTPAAPAKPSKGPWDDDEDCDDDDDSAWPVKPVKPSGGAADPSAPVKPAYWPKPDGGKDGKPVVNGCAPVCGPSVTSRRRLTKYSMPQPRLLSTPRPAMPS